MKTTLILIGTVIASAGAFLMLPEDKKAKPDSDTKIPYPQFEWRLASPAGTGKFQEEWLPGKWPMGLTPVVAFNGDLWMTGQKMAWSSSDGIHWDAHPKKDWGERISMARVFFDNKLWMFGGYKIKGDFQNDIWSSNDGASWDQVKKNAAWSPRKGHTVVVFNNRLWLFGGAVSVKEDLTPHEFLNDVWSSRDGLEWNREMDHAPWPPRDYPNVVVYKNQLWMIGGQGHAGIWRSPDGKNWTLIKKEAPWGPRDDFGALVYENLLFVYGGRGGNPAEDKNDVWFSFDGETWHQQTAHAPWVEQTGSHSVVFNKKLWLYSGKHKGHPRTGDIWTMEPR